jgi:hypothetical protein
METRVIAAVPDLIRFLVRDGFRESHAGKQLRLEMALVAIGAKPALWNWVQVRPDGTRQVGFGDHWWDPTPLLEAMQAKGFVVVSRPDHLLPDREMLVVAPSRTRAERIHALGRLAWAEEQAGFPSLRNTCRLGALLGYPRQGAMAYAGRLPRADLRDLPIRVIDRPFAGFVIADTDAGVASAVRLIERRGQMFREGYGDDLYDEAELLLRRLPPRRRAA